MRRTGLLLAIILFSLNSAAYAQNFKGKLEKEIIVLPPQKSLKIGERLTYSVELLGVPVGKITLNTQGIEKIDNNECYHIIARARLNRFFAKLYDIEYTVHTYINKDTFFTHRFEKIRRFKDKIHRTVIDFDHDKKEAQYNEEGSAPLLEITTMRGQVADDIPATLKIINGTQDLFSSFYYLRLLEMEENKPYKINIYYDRRNWSIEAKRQKPFLKDIRNKGTFTVFEVSMDSRLGEFILGRSKIFVYFTADPRRIPLEFKFKTGIGSVRGIIQDITN